MSTHKRSAGTSSDNCVVKKACGASVHIGAENSSTLKTIATNQSAMQIVNRNDVEILEEPDKSENDKKLYRVIQLKNGLKALIIYDPVADAQTMADFSKCNVKTNATSATAAMVSDEEEESESEASDEEEDGTEGEAREKLAACSLSVDVGSFSDPRDVQGLAHFLGTARSIHEIASHSILS